MGRRMDDWSTGSKEWRRYASKTPMSWNSRAADITAGATGCEPRQPHARPQGGAVSRVIPPATRRSRSIRMDHRLGKRYRAFHLAELSHGDAGGDDVRCAGLLYNVSRGGMFVVTGAQLGVNRCVDVRIAYAGGMLRVPALIVHRGNGGLGLMFRQLDGETAAAVEALCTSP